LTLTLLHQPRLRRANRLRTGRVVRAKAQVLRRKTRVRRHVLSKLLKNLHEVPKLRGRELSRLTLRVLERKQPTHIGLTDLSIRRTQILRANTEEVPL